MRLRQGGQARVSGDERSTVGRRVRSDALEGGGGGGGGAEANPGGLRSDNVALGLLSKSNVRKQKKNCRLSFSFFLP